MKQLIVLCDGTGNSPEANTGTWAPTNVQILKNMLGMGLKKEAVGYNFEEGWALEKFHSDGKEILVHYDRGLGSPKLDDNGNLIRWGWQPSSFFSNARFIYGKYLEANEQVNALGIIDNVAQAYRFLAKNYEEGDEVFLFGFSRGAYTLRLLISIIRYIGLLDAKKYLSEKAINDAIEKGFSLYDMSLPPDDNQAAKNFRSNCYPYENLVKFLGLWDTVPGLVKEKVYDISNLTSVVKIARHAISIDEERKDFVPALWAASAKTESKQVWFPGVHCDVGGSYLDAGLSNLTLHWIVKEAYSAGLSVDIRLLNIYKVVALSMQHDSLNALVKENFNIPWAIRGTYSRPVLKANETEWLHTSVVERYNHIIKKENISMRYLPLNLSTLTAADWARVEPSSITISAEVTLPLSAAMEA